MSKRDYYEILEVTKTASDQEIKSSYRRLALKYHPDRNSGDKAAEEKFKEAAEAYSILSDSDKRARYDRHGHAGVGGGAQGFDPSAFTGFEVGRVVRLIAHLCLKFRWGKPLGLPSVSSRRAKPAPRPARRYPPR